MVHTMALHDSGPTAVRYPRGEGTGVALPAVPERLEIGKGRIVREGKKVAILSLGTRLAEALKAADVLEARGAQCHRRRSQVRKPLDEALIRSLLTSHEVAVTIEEAAIGGFGAHVLTLASDEGLIDAGLPASSCARCACPTPSRTMTSPTSNMPKPPSTPTRLSRRY